MLSRRCTLQLEGRSQEGARSVESDKSELKQLARMMPDPAEDELFDDSESAACQQHTLYVIDHMQCSGPSQVRMAWCMHHCYSPGKRTVDELLLVAVPVPSYAVHLQRSWGAAGLVGPSQACNSKPVQTS